MVDAKNLTIGTFIALSLILGGVIVTDADNSYYCPTKDLVGICDKLSGGLGTRCYYNSTYKYCPDGWKPLEDYVEKVNDIPIPSIGKKWLCHAGCPASCEVLE